MTKNKQVVVGKNVIEVLTEGMYDNPLVIYREYVQNSVDSINHAVELGFLKKTEDGSVQISINPHKKCVEISDNGTGIPRNDAWSLLTSVAASTKDRKKHLGFRGIGRLAGLAYCQSLIIETSYPGEDFKTELEWDGDQLRKIIGDHDDKRKASEVIEAITKFKNDLPENKDLSYFKVKLLNVKHHKILNADEVKKYLRIVAPVPFKPQFIFSPEITKRLRASNVNLGELHIAVNDEELRKPYRTNIYRNDNKLEKSIDEIIDVPEIEIFDESSGKTIAKGWYSLTKQMQRIPAYNEASGIRIRKGNIEIGDNLTVQRFFSDERFHHYFVGEIHVVSNDLTPNGQRDYFDTSPTLHIFEEKMYKIAYKLARLCHDTSAVNSALEKIGKYELQMEEFKAKEADGKFLSPTHEQEERRKLEDLAEKADSSKEALKKIEKKAAEDDALSRILKHRIPEAIAGISPSSNDDQSQKNEGSKKNGKKRYLTHGFSTLNRKERKIVGDILEIINKILTPDIASNLVLKIEEHFRDGESAKK